MGLYSRREHVVELDPTKVDDDVVAALKREIAQQSDLNGEQIDLVTTVVLDSESNLHNHAKVVERPDNANSE